MGGTGKTTISRLRAAKRTAEQRAGIASSRDMKIEIYNLGSTGTGNLGMNHKTENHAENHAEIHCREMARQSAV